MPDNHDAALTRLKKLGNQLDSAKHSAEETVKDVTRAKATTDGIITKDVRVLDTSATAKRRSKRRPKAKAASTRKRGAKKRR